MRNMETHSTNGQEEITMVEQKLNIMTGKTVTTEESKIGSEELSSMEEQPASGQKEIDKVVREPIIGTGKTVIIEQSLVEIREVSRIVRPPASGQEGQGQPTSGQ